MSDSDSFIDEVTEEVRRDRLFGLLKKWGWVPALLIVGVVGGTAWNEYSKSQSRAEAEALGDAVLAAQGQQDAEARSAALAQIDAPSPEARAVLALLQGSAVETSGDAPAIYEQIAGFKALLDADPAARRDGLSAIATPGHPLRLLAEEQLALLDLAEGQADAAATRLRAISDDAETPDSLRQRATLLLEALGAQG